MFWFSIWEKVLLWKYLVHFALESSFCEIVASCDSEERRRHPSDVHEAEEQQLRFWIKDRRIDWFVVVIDMKTVFVIAFAETQPSQVEEQQLCFGVIKHRIEH